MPDRRLALNQIDTNVQQKAGFVQEPGRKLLTTVPQQVYLRKPEEGRALKDAQEVAIQIDIVRAIAGGERIRNHGEAWSCLGLLRGEQRQMRREVRDIDGRLRHRGIIEVQDGKPLTIPE